MALDDLIPEDSEDNVGGRPKEKEDKSRRADGPTPEELESESYWREVYSRIVKGDEPTSEEIAKICGETYLFPWDVKVYLEKFEVQEFDWEQMPDDYPPGDSLAKWLEEEGVENDFVKKAKADRAGLETSGGLANLVTDAKDEN